MVKFALDNKTWKPEMARTVQELVDRGFYSQQEAQRAANKNYVTRALGVESTVEVDVTEVPVEKGDVFLLCSDGLNSMLTDGEMAALLEEGGSLQEMTERLIVRANEHGGNDNITVVLLRVCA